MEKIFDMLSELKLKSATFIAEDENGKAVKLYFDGKDLLDLQEIMGKISPKDMNEYQEALNKIIHTIANLSEASERWIKESGAIKKMQKLVDKATPQEPPRQDRMVCPVCNAKAVLRYDLPNPEYCCWCGQRLNLSNE